MRLRKGMQRAKGLICSKWREDCDPFYSRVQVSCCHKRLHLNIDRYEFGLFPSCPVSYNIEVCHVL